MKPLVLQWSKMWFQLGGNCKLRQSLSGIGVRITCDRPWEYLLALYRMQSPTAPPHALRSSQLVSQLSQLLARVDAPKCCLTAYRKSSWILLATLAGLSAGHNAWLSLADSHCESQSAFRAQDSGLSEGRLLKFMGFSRHNSTLDHIGPSSHALSI